MISLRIVIVPGPNYDKIKIQGLIYIQLTFGNGLDYEYYQHYGHMDNQTLLKHKFSNSLMVSVIHNINQNIHLNASLISSSISPSWISLDVLLLLSLPDWTHNHKATLSSTRRTHWRWCSHCRPGRPLLSAPATLPLTATSRKFSWPGRAQR